MLPRIWSLQPSRMCLHRRVPLIKLVPYSCKYGWLGGVNYKSLLSFQNVIFGGPCVSHEESRSCNTLHSHYPNTAITAPLQTCSLHTCNRIYSMWSENIIIIIIQRRWGDSTVSYNYMYSSWTMIPCKCLTPITSNKKATSDIDPSQSSPVPLSLINYLLQPEAHTRSLTIWWTNEGYWSNNWLLYA